MSQRRFHWLEKFQVQVATLAALAATYFVFWHAFEAFDPQAPIAFLPYGNYAGLGLLALLVWGFAAGAALLTVNSRPESAMIAALIGAGGLSLRSPSMRGLLWLQPDGMNAMFGRLIVETIFLAAILVGAYLIIFLVRRLVAAVCPGWMWKGNMSQVDSPEALLMSPDPWGRQAISLGLAVLVTGVLFMLLVKSTLRGQVLFAIFIGSLVASLGTNQAVPSHRGIFAWVAPMLVGIGFYVLGIIHSVKGDMNAWMVVSLEVQALPIDWLTAGAGGGALGFWFSQRIREASHMERMEKEKA